LNLVPALLQDKREIKVKDEGNPDRLPRIGDEEAGTVIVRAKPRIADVNILEASRAPFSRCDSLDLKSTKGCIMYEFHRKPASKLLIETVEASEDLQSTI